MKNAIPDPDTQYERMFADDQRVMYQYIYLQQEHLNKLNNSCGQYDKKISMPTIVNMTMSRTQRAREREIDIGRERRERGGGGQRGERQRARVSE